MVAVFDTIASAKEPVSQAMKLRDTLEEEIINGVLKPGDRLDEAVLAERFQVSRTPIREAFNFLIGLGLLETLPKRGCFVARIGLPRLVQMFEVLAEFEGMCARLASRRVTDTQADELRALLKDCAQAKKSGDLDAYFRNNERFHNGLHKASQNSFLIQQTRQLRTRLKPYLRLQLGARNRPAMSLEEHRVIVDSILAGDECAAEAKAKDHVMIQGERFADLVAALDDNAA